MYFSILFISIHKKKKKLTIIIYYVPVEIFLVGAKREGERAVLIKNEAIFVGCYNTALFVTLVK